MRRGRSKMKALLGNPRTHGLRWLRPQGSAGASDVDVAPAPRAARVQPPPHVPMRPGEPRSAGRSRRWGRPVAEPGLPFAQRRSSSRALHPKLFLRPALLARRAVSAGGGRPAPTAARAAGCLPAAHRPDTARARGERRAVAPAACCGAGAHWPCARPGRVQGPQLGQEHTGTGPVSPALRGCRPRAPGGTRGTPAAAERRPRSRRYRRTRSQRAGDRARLHTGAMSRSAQPVTHELAGGARLAAAGARPGRKKERPRRAELSRLPVTGIAPVLAVLPVAARVPGPGAWCLIPAAWSLCLRLHARASAPVSAHQCRRAWARDCAPVPQCSPASRPRATQSAQRRAPRLRIAERRRARDAARRLVPRR